MNTKLKTIAEQLIALTSKEAGELSQILKNDYGIELANSNIGSIKPSTPVEVVQEKTIFDVILKEVGAQKLSIVKMIKDMTGLGLREAMDLVNTSPASIKQGISKAEAESIKNKLEEIGGVVELK